MWLWPLVACDLTSYFPKATYLTLPKRQNVPHPHVKRPPDPSIMLISREMTLTIQKSNNKDNGS